MKITLTELKYIIKKIIQESNIVSLEEPVQHLNKAIKKNSEKQNHEEDKTKSFLIDFIENVLDLPYDENSSLSPSNIILKKLLKKIPHKIKSFIGRGKYGRVYELEGNYVLKLYEEEYNFRDPGSDYKWYKKNTEDIFSGGATINSLPVIDSGFVETMYPEREYGKKHIIVYFVIMAKLKMFYDIMKQSKRLNKFAPDKYRKYFKNNNYLLEVHKDQIANFNDMFSYKIPTLEEFFKGAKLFTPIIGVYDQPTERDKEKISELDKYFKEKNFDLYLEEEIENGGLTVNEIKGLYKAFLQLKKTMNGPIDVHLGNIGILPTSDPANPEFIIFDK